MQLLSIDLSNFGSYEKLEFDFTDLGLSLVSGPTGSGKSTLQDGPYWVMFGELLKVAMLMKLDLGLHLSRLLVF